MTTLSNEAFAVMAACERTKQPFGITVDKICSGQYKFVWAFKIDKEKAQREGYGKINVKGNITLDTEYPGCPYCGEKTTHCLLIMQQVLLLPWTGIYYMPQLWNEWKCGISRTG